jgi:hypothetical protein
VKSITVKDECEPAAVTVVINVDCTDTCKSTVNDAHCAVAQKFVTINIDCIAAESVLTATGAVQ